MLTADEKLTRIREKIKRAKKHLVDLETERDRFFYQDPYEVDSYDDPQTGDHLFKLIRLNDLPPSIALIAGDVIHNTRSALDHLARQLTKPRHRNPWTSFPIFDRRPTMREALNVRQIKGMSYRAKKRICNAEPYKGGQGNYLWVLHHLDIADKHHGLLPHVFHLSYSLVGRGTVTKGPTHTETMTFGVGQAKRFGHPLKTGDVFLTLPKAYKNVSFAFDIGINERNVIENMPIIMLLNSIISRVDKLILSFRPDL